MQNKYEQFLSRNSCKVLKKRRDIFLDEMIEIEREAEAEANKRQYPYDHFVDVLIDERFYGQEY